MYCYYGSSLRHNILFASYGLLRQNEVIRQMGELFTSIVPTAASLKVLAKTGEQKASLITYRIGWLNFNDHNNYPEPIDEVIAKGALFASVFKKYVGDRSLTGRAGGF